MQPQINRTISRSLIRVSGYEQQSTDVTAVSTSPMTWTINYRKRDPLVGDTRCTAHVHRVQREKISSYHEHHERTSTRAGRRDYESLFDQSLSLREHVRPILIWFDLILPGAKLCILGIFTIVNFSTSVGYFEDVLRCSLERWKIVNGCSRREIKNCHYRYLLIVKLSNRMINEFVAKENVRVEEVQLKWTVRRRARD